MPQVNSAFGDKHVRPICEVDELIAGFMRGEVNTAGESVVPTDEELARELADLLAGIFHSVWVGWMRWYLSGLTSTEDGARHIAADQVDELMRQINSTYEDLPEWEQAALRRIVIERLSEMDATK